MNMIEQAKDFVNRLLHPNDPRRCAHCHKRMTKKNGTRPVTIRDLDGVREERHQNWWCHLCKRSYYVSDPRREKWARYTRRVKRKGLDMYVHLGGSLRGVAQWLRSEANPGTERAKVWDPLSKRKAGPEAKLNHTSLWRWLQKAGERVEKKGLGGWYRGLIRFSGALVADGTGVKIRGVSVPLHLICDAASRVGMRIARLAEESNVAIRGQFWALLRDWGIKVAEIKVLISDGAQWYRYALDWILRKARQQRSIFHLWRNILPAIRSFEAEAGKEMAEQFISEVKGVWNADTLASAQQKLVTLKEKWKSVVELADALGLIEKTLAEAMTHTLGIVEGMGRTSNVAERFFRRYKQRVRRMGCFMSLGGCDNFNAVWEVYINLEPYQVRKEIKKRYRYPGLCPLEVGSAQIQGITWLDAVGI